VLRLMLAAFFSWREVCARDDLFDAHGQKAARDTCHGLMPDHTTELGVHRKDGSEFMTSATTLMGRFTINQSNGFVCRPPGGRIVELRSSLL